MIGDMKSRGCSQVFRFGPNRHYTSQTMVELPLLVTRLDERKEFLRIPTYLEVGCSIFVLQKDNGDFKFKIDGKRKILEMNIDGKKKEF